MRNPNRLDTLYETLKNLHKENFPDIRFLQLMHIFFNWLNNHYQTDGFYIEDNELINKFTEFCKNIQGKT